MIFFRKTELLDIISDSKITTHMPFSFIVSQGLNTIRFFMMFIYQKKERTSELLRIRKHCFLARANIGCFRDLKE